MSGALALSLMFATAAAPDAGSAPADAAEEAEILVLANKLANISLNIQRDGQGRLSCAPVQSTGLPKLDARLCEATAKCVRKGDWSNEAVKLCVTKSRPALMADVRALLRERRAQEAERREKEAGI